MDSDNTSSDTSIHSNATDAYFSHFPSYTEWRTQQENQHSTLEQYHDKLHAHSLLPQNDLKQSDAAFAVAEYLAKRSHTGGMNSYGAKLVAGCTPGGFRDRKEGFAWVEKSAKLGFAKAKRNLAVYLSEGIVCEKNGKEALRWAYEAMYQDCADAYYTLGLIYLDGDVVPRDYFKAAGFLQHGMDLGSVDCISSLGRQYLKGRGVAKNVPKALELFKKAIGLGNLMAEFYLGYVYKNGADGVPKDHSAIRNLGHCYENGEGVPQSYEISLEYFTRAANSGDDEAVYFLGKKYEYGSGVPQDYTKAYEYYERAAKLKHKKAICNLGCLLSDGLGCTKDPVRGAELFQQSAALGNGNGHLLQANASFLPLRFDSLWVDQMLFHGPHAFQVAYIETRLNVMQEIGFIEQKYVSERDFKICSFCVKDWSNYEHPKARRQGPKGSEGTAIILIAGSIRWWWRRGRQLNTHRLQCKDGRKHPIPPSELLTQTFRRLHPKQCILLPPILVLLIEHLGKSSR